MPVWEPNATLYNSADVEVGTAGSPLRIDPTGTTTQPVSGTVTANQGTAAVIANAWVTQITDGVNSAAVMNSAPVGTEYGLVVRPVGTFTTTETRPATSTVTTVALGAVVVPHLRLPDF